MLVINFSKRVKPIWKKKNCINNKRKLRLSYDMSQIGQIRLTNIARQRAFLPKTQSGGVTLHKVTQQMNYITKTESLKNITNDLGIAYLLTSGINMCSACLSHIFWIWMKGIEEEKQYDFDWNGDCVVEPLTTTTLEYHPFNCPSPLGPASHCRSVTIHRAEI